jgi:hypothetical protein
MILFHASTTHYETGAKLIAQERSVDRFNAEFESELAIHAPDGMGDRVSSVFATETAALAARYLEAEGMWEGPLYLYEVRAESKSRHPMALIDIAAKRIQTESFQWIALEYWGPTRQWRAWEHLCNRAEILRELSWPSLVERSVAFEHYRLDSSEATSIYCQSAAAT